MNRKKTSAERDLSGNPSRRPTIPRPKAAPGIPRMPKGLPEDAQAEWKRVIAILGDEDRLSKHDGGLILHHVMLFARLCECQRIITTGGIMVKGQRGTVKNPCVQLERSYSQLYLKSTEVLGIDPRRRDVAPKATGDDPDGELD